MNCEQKLLQKIYPHHLFLFSFLSFLLVFFPVLLPFDFSVFYIQFLPEIQILLLLLWWCASPLLKAFVITDFGDQILAQAYLPTNVVFPVIETQVHLLKHRHGTMSPRLSYQCFYFQLLLHCSSLWLLMECPCIKALLWNSIF